MRQRRRAERQQSARSASPQIAGRRLNERQRQRLLLVAIAAALVVLVAILSVGWYINEYRVPRKVVAEIDGVQYQLRDVFPYAVLDGVASGSFSPQQGLNNLLGDGIIERKSSDIGAVIEPGAVDADIVSQFEPLREGGEAGPPTSLSEEGRELLERFLDTFGVSEEVYRAWLAGQLRRQSALEHFSALAPETTEQIHVEAIITSAVTSARDAVARLEEGQEFAEVAGEFNEFFLFSDAATAGWVPEGVLQPDVNGVLFREGIEHGEVQGPHIINIGAIVFRITEGPSEEPLADAMRLLWGEKDFQEWLDAQAVGLRYYFTPDDAQWLVDQLEGS
ncbi:MAG: hypothetical protein OXL97_05195 [Chloroflexota bacterium]|nr:hypothetical protein [Chloroflexota bacterium]MDE2884026.1 hypothetical protein [Chloroflexota bacterium]